MDAGAASAASGLNLFDSGDESERNKKARSGLQDTMVSKDAEAIIAALNASLGVKIDNVGSRVEELGQHVGRLDTKTTKIQAEMDVLRARIENLENNTSRAGSSAASTSASTRPGLGFVAEGGEARGAMKKDFENKTPKAKRHVVCVGGFPGTWDREEVEDALKKQLEHHAIQGISDVYAIGKFANRAKIVFTTPSTMWAFMKRMAGKRMQVADTMLWHTVDKDPDELELARKVSYAVRTLREYAIGRALADTDNAKRVIDGDWDRGVVVYRKGGAARPCMMLMRDRTSGKVQVAPQAQELFAEGGDFAGFDIKGELPLINDPPRL
mmetsp:Transcript_121221/g.338335  ORF Transcript_121221/g.338335 Transcript_121221/m.338335 type:complete len:326 (+) Transcript_121221:53-1030(+)